MTPAPFSRARIGLPRLYPWQRVILRLVIAMPGATAREIGERYFPAGNATLRQQAALHELRILERGNWCSGIAAAGHRRCSRPRRCGSAGGARDLARRLDRPAAGGDGGDDNGPGHCVAGRAAGV
jgi:hypothetical protein